MLIRRTFLLLFNNVNVNDFWGREEGMRRGNTTTTTPLHPRKPQTLPRHRVPYIRTPHLRHLAHQLLLPFLHTIPLFYLLFDKIIKAFGFMDGVLVFTAKYKGFFD
jgi:hypothetical protein